MALEMGDIADVYDWEDDYNTRGNASGVKAAEETRVGTQASFEQLLERELAKEQEGGSANGGGNSKRRGVASGSKPRQSFLRKGSRGWWMENPEAKHKLQKHTLTSVDTEENGSVRPAPRMKPKAAPRASKPREDAYPNGWQESPTLTPAAETNGVDLSPVRLSPMRRQASDDEPVETVRRTLPMWASRMDRAGKGVRESVESTLGMSVVRQEYEARIEQEADELADFEALERELAAEKAAYLREKQEGKHGRQYTSFSGFDEEEKDDSHDAAMQNEDEDDGDASWLRESEDEMGSLQDNASHRASTSRFRRSSHSSLDLGGESSMVFDGDHHVFRSPQLPRGVSRSRPSFAPSEISAVSLNESEPWGDAHALDHFSRLPESPIAKHGMTSVLLNPDGDASHSLSFASNGHHESLWAGKGEDRAYEDVDHVEDSFQHFDDYDPVPQSTRRAPSMRDRGAPVSSLVQQVFGRGNQWEEEEDVRSVPSSAPPMKRQTEPVNAPAKVGKQKNSKPSSTSKKASSREQGAADEPKAMPRRRAPGFGAPGTLPVAVEEKLAELEEEVRFYKSETLQLQKKKAHFDDELQKLARQKDAIASFEEEQRRLIEQEWEQERLKMRREERTFERQMKLKLSAASSASSRKDRAEIDTLKAQIVKLQLEAKQVNAKSKSTNDVLRQRIAELEGKTREQSEEIKFLEKDRLDQWQKYEELLKEMNSQKQKWTSDRDGLKTVQDISHIGRTAEQLMSSLGLQPSSASASPTSPNEYLSSVASTPTYAHEDTYNPGRYRNTAFYSQSRDQSLFAGHERQREVQTPETREAASNQDDERDATSQVANEVVHPGGKREITYQDGTKKIYFADGNEKEIQPDGHVLIRFTNGDRKEYFPSTGISVYHYFEAQTKLTTYPDKTKVYEFPNQQTEKSYPDGRTEIQFADGIKKIIHPNGDEVSTFPDGTTMLEDKEGIREVTLLNGKKVRYYPNGSMALVGVDGKESEVRSDDELKELMETL